MLVKAFESEDLLEARGVEIQGYLTFLLPLSLVNHPTSLLFHKSSATIFCKEWLVTINQQLSTHNSQLMFGFSLAELMIVLLVILLFIKPQDLPEIARFVGKAFYRLKRLYHELKKSLREMEKEFGLEEVRDEFNRAISEEKAKLEDDTTIIVDMNGKEHRVPNITNLRSDLNEDELQKEIKRSNEVNSRKE